jgi:hypothetical protein
VKVDLYVRFVLTAIAAALVYLCVVFTPLPAAIAQTAPRPGDDTGPARCVIVGWKTTDHIPVEVLDSITLKTTGEMRVTGVVQTEQRPNSTTRVVLTGWEEGASAPQPGALRPLTREATGSGLPPGIPVTTVTTR